MIDWPCLLHGLAAWLIGWAITAPLRKPRTVIQVHKVFPPGKQEIARQYRDHDPLKG